MTVELVKPFVWPSTNEPENDPKKIYDFGHEELKEIDKYSEKMQESQSSLRDAAKMPEDRRERLREHAQQLLEGKLEWKPPASIAPSGLRSLR